MVAFVSIGVETSGLTVDNAAGVSVGDVLLLVTHSDDDITVTPPAGWTTGLRIATGGGLYGLQYSWKVADSSDAAASNFTYTRDFSTASRSYIVCLSGNHATTPIREQQGTSPLSTAAASPLSVALTGVTPSANDAVVYIGHIRPVTGTDRWSFAAPGSYTERMDFNADVLSGTLATRDNVSAGATGTLTATGTRTVGSSNGQFAGIVIAIAAAGGGGGPTSYYLSDTVEM